ncbi:MAG: hypothetical protein UT65_C0016G0004 [Parcubacteria group bacterium GW2011_GWF2_39_8b]|nr:MAG: hypothetical protein UT65_C0016G0004 [Parcubacteria group bacterium GW2011_GWF2_39_8b]KKR46011.1 MAG: hypothetical protein UT81_C0003G0028 [Parcubacteria group bacterium GW2011_GWA2_40_14]
MDKKSKVLLILFIFSIIISAFISFYRYIYLEDITFFTDANSVPNALDSIKNLLKI